MSRILDHFPNGWTPSKLQRDVLVELEHRWNSAQVFVLKLDVACHAKGQRVLRYDGSSVAIEDIHIGDELLGPDGTRRIVRATHTGKADMYQVNANRYGSYVVTGNHIWPVEYDARKRTNGKVKCFRENRQVSTYELAQMNDSAVYRHYLTSAPALEHDYQDLPMDPYIFGLWLGDGSSGSSALTTMDTPIADVWTKYGKMWGCDVRVEVKPGNKAKTFYLKTSRGKPNPVLKQLQYLKVYKNKHIPEQYFMGSTEQRRALLAGLTDSDGHVTGGIEITQVREQLAKQIQRLAHSLGLSATLAVKLINNKEYYRVYIAGQDLEFLPTLLPHKRPKSCKRNLTNRRFKVTHLGMMDYYGVTVDKDNLYVLEDNTITHNSGKSAVAACIAKWLQAKGGRGAGARICTPTNVLVDQYGALFESDLAVIKSASQYTCESRNSRCGAFSNKLRCKECPYKQAFAEAKRAPISVSTYHMSKVLYSHRGTMIFDECFLFGTPIKTSGGMKTIGSIYKEWDRGEDTFVESLNTKTGKLESKKVTHAWKRPTEQPLVSVNFGRRKITCTANHKILKADMTYCPASDLKEGDQVVAVGSGRDGGLLIPQGTTRQVVLGSVLGDGYWRKDNHCQSGKRLSIRHSQKQTEYINYKAMLLGVPVSINGRSGVTKEPQLVCNTKYLKDTGITTKKQALDNLTTEGLAIWFQDDGSTGRNKNKTITARFHTESWSTEEVHYAQKILKERWNLDSTVYFYRKNYPIISLGAKATSLLQDLLKDYVHPSMQYKLKLKDYHTPKLLGTTDTYAEYRLHTVSSVQDLGHTSKFVYDIEVEDNHNFIVAFHMLSKNGVVVHNCHNLGRVIRDMYSKKVFAHKVLMPQACVGEPELTEKWVQSLTEYDLDRLTLNERTLLAQYRDDLKAEKPLNFYSWSTDFWSNGGEMWGEKLYKGEATEAPVLVQQPLDVFSKPSLFWQDNQKLVLMSATIGIHDMYELGLDRSRPIFIEGDPPISFDRNPIIKDYIGKLNFQNQEQMLPKLAAKVMDYLNTKKGKGVIHITYGLAKLLKPLIKHERLITHSSSNMRAKLKEFLASDNGVFLVSGMYEGVSLDYNLADWQVISKIVWPSLTDPLQKYRAVDDPDYYLWSTFKNVVQASGRVCRRPDDFGITYVWDESFERLLSEGSHLVSTNFKGRIQE